MGLYIVGIVLIAIGGGLFYLQKQSLDKALDIKYYETSKISDVISTYNELKDTIGVGNYSGNIVELNGRGLSSQPLTAEHSQRPVLFYESSVEREYEVREQERDSDGNYRTVTKRRSETVSRNSEYIIFDLDDGSGATLKIDMQGASKDLQQSVDRFEREAPRGFQSSFSSQGSKTLGYRYRESIIPNNTQLYILGEVNDRSGELMLTRPKEKGKNFIVSTKSEDELIRSAESSAKWQKIGAIVSAIAGLGTIIFAIIS